MVTAGFVIRAGAYRAARGNILQEPRSANGAAPPPFPRPFRSARPAASPERGMNTNLRVAFLLPLLAASLSAQDMKLEATMAPYGMQAKAHGADDGSLVVLVLGLREARIKLPDGQLLGVQPDLVTGFAIADGTRSTDFVLRLPRDAAGFDFFTQAVAVSPKLPIDQRGAIALSDVQHLAEDRR